VDERAGTPDPKEHRAPRDWLNLSASVGGDTRARPPGSSFALRITRLKQIAAFSGEAFGRFAQLSAAYVTAQAKALRSARSKFYARPETQELLERARPYASGFIDGCRRFGLGAFRRARTLRWGYWLAGAVLGVGVLCAAYVIYCLAGLPFKGGLVVEPTSSALTVQSEDGRIFGTRGVFKGEKLSASDLPASLAQAIIAIEDRRFYQHPGIDLKGLARAVFRNASAGGTREGGSTITQQLVRMLYLSQERTLKRKVQEAILALWLEGHLSKEEILTTYLNTAYFGAGVYGADAAAKRYFGKAAKDLTLAEAAMLAGLVRAPSQLAPHRNLNGAQGRAAQVLDAMVETGAITLVQAEDAKRDPAQLRMPADTPEGTNYFIDLVSTEARRLIGSGPTDLVAKTTINLDLQNLAESTVARYLDKDGASKRVSQAALVALAPDGAILAMVGGRDYTESQFNRVTQAKRQPGSLFKLFVYLTALRAGARPDTMMVDRPTQIGEWEPENYGGRYRGPVTLKTAFANSINTIAVQLAESVGIQAVINTAKGLGIRSELPNVPSLALGSAEVTLLEMTQAFAAVAVNTEKLEPFVVRSIMSGDKNVYTRPATSLPPQQNPAARAAMLDLLSSVVREGTGKAARLSVPVAGKTGTTQDNRDAWFVGFTPDLIVGVWVGNDDNSPTNNVTGGGLPASIWHDFVAQAARKRPAGAAPTAVVAAIGPGTAGVSASAQAPLVPLRGPASVVDTGTLEINGQAIRLFGVEGTSGARALRDFDRVLRRGDVVCVPAAEEAGTYRCSLHGRDLSELVLFNGGGRASPDASPDLLAAEEQARSARAGLWRR
jgi:penicillin-binding protein 1A